MYSSICCSRCNWWLVSEAKYERYVHFSLALTFSPSLLSSIQTLGRISWLAWFGVITILIASKFTLLLMNSGSGTDRTSLRESHRSWKAAESALRIGVGTKRHISRQLMF